MSQLPRILKQHPRAVWGRHARKTVRPEASLRKEDAPCCIAAALPDGRLPIGYCGPDCLRRPPTNP